MGRSRRSNGLGTLFRRKPGGPWIARWYDCDGKRRERSTRTTDKAAANRILSKAVSEAALRREGVIDKRQDTFAQANRRPLADHIDEYIRHCRHIGQAKRHVDQKESHLRKLRESTGATRVADLTADSVERYLRTLRNADKSARTINVVRQTAVTFLEWCVKTVRVESNPLKVLPKLDESRDRRRVRRPLTDDELAALLAVAGDHGRRLWYLLAALAGLRRSDLENLTWADVDFEACTVTIREGEAKRTDVVPLHPELVVELRKCFEANPAPPKARVFAQSVSWTTQNRDFYRAGLARKEYVYDENGNHVMVGKSQPRKKVRYNTEDAEGRVVDLHALRTTLGTNLARAGVVPQVAQQIMRHGDYRTTLAHYTVLGLSDTARAIEQLPGLVPQMEQLAATGTADHCPTGETLRKHGPGSTAGTTTGTTHGANHQGPCVAYAERSTPAATDHTPNNSPNSSNAKRDETVRPNATTPADDDVTRAAIDNSKSGYDNSLCDPERGDAKDCNKAGDATRTRNIQLGRLMLYH